MKNLFKNIIHSFSKTAGEKNEIDEIMTVALVAQRVFGQQILDPDWSWRSFYHYHVLTLCLFVYVIFGTLKIVVNTTELMLAAEGTYTFVLIVFFPIKLLIFIHNRTECRKLYVAAKTTLFDAIKRDSSEKAKEVLRNGHKVLYALVGMIIFPVSSYEITALWNYLNGNRILLSRSTATLMPMTSPYYEIAWFLHSVFLVQMAITITIIDMWYVFFMFFACVASDSLVKTLQFNGRGIEESQVSYAERLNKELRRFYCSHVQVVGYLNKLNEIFKWLFLVPLLNVGLCICIILFVLSKEANWNFALNMFPAIAELFAYCWFGELMRTKVNMIRTALVEFDWTQMDTSGKKAYYIILTYMEREYSVKTAIMGIDLSMITMTSVFKVSYQVFTVLKTMEN